MRLCRGKAVRRVNLYRGETVKGCGCTRVWLYRDSPVQVWDSTGVCLCVSAVTCT